jgi:predicted MFS family arabinose efflux permease
MSGWRKVHYDSAGAVTGFFGLVGAVGAAGAPTVGDLADKHGPRFTIRVALWLSLFSFLFLGFAGRHLAGLIVGVILMDLGVQSGHVSNQTRIYSIDPNARSRLNMVYMFCYFIGGALGSYLGARCWHVAGWWGVCGFGTTAIFLGIAAEFTCERRAIRGQQT